MRSTSLPPSPDASEPARPGVVAYGRDPRQQVRTWPLPGARDRVLVLPGGGWAHGDPDGPFARAAVAWAHRRSWHAAVLSHRLLPQADPLQQAEDVAQAMHVADRVLAAQGPAEGACLVLAHSAGAHLAALVHVGPLQALAGVSAWTASVFVDTAALDVPRLMTWPHAPLHDRAFGADPECWLACSPRHQVRQPGPPMLLAVAEGRPGALLQARSFAAAVQAAGGRADVQPLPLAHDGMAAGLADGGALSAAVDTFLASLGCAAPGRPPRPAPMVSSSPVAAPDPHRRAITDP